MGLRLQGPRLVSGEGSVLNCPASCAHNLLLFAYDEKHRHSIVP